MRELPKSVIERLRASAPAGEHPDADVLTAFAEQALPASERAVVSEHVARCGDCREILALALPAAEVVAPAVGGVGVGSGWRWPVLRGFAVAAVVIAVAAIGINRFQHSAPASVMVARNAEHEQTAGQQVQNEKAPAAPRPEAVSPSSEPRNGAVPSGSALFAGKASSKAADGLDLRAESTGGLAGLGAGTGSGAGAAQGAKTAMAAPPRDLAFAPRAPTAQTKKEILMGVPERRDATGAATETVEVQAQSEVITAEATSPSPLLDRQTADLQASPDGGDRVRRAKPSTASNAAPAAAFPVVARNQINLHPVQQAHWTISSTGSLQRSLDGGKTWQDVNVNSKAGLYGESMQVEIASSDRLTKAAGKNNRETKATAAPVFRAVTAFGSDVWAGASGGLLYHSADAGTVWTSMVPSVRGATLSGDVIRIEFSDSLHGKITTSTSETWTTDDGGQSWLKL